MSKIKLLVYTGFILGAMLIGSSSAEDAVSGYTYQRVAPHVDFYSGYQWRPAESSYLQADKGVTTYRGGAELLPGRTQLPMGLPPGKYRPFEKERAISPQAGAFRFRSISPEEQSRIEKTGTSASDVKSDRYTGGFKYRGYDNETPFRAPETKYKYRFRPDTRFPSYKSGKENSGAMTGPSQAYPPVYTIPVFRQENRGR